MAAVLSTMLLLCTMQSAAVAFPGSSGLPVPPTSQTAFENWLVATGQSVKSRYHGYTASYPTWRDYKMLVYGSPNQVSGNRYDAKTGQYASLGYSFDELVVTNSLFRDDAPGGITQTTPWQWKELAMGQSAVLSWARLTTRQKDFIKNSQLTYRNNSYGGMTFQKLGLLESTTVVLAPPSWHMGFALYTTHYLPGSKSNLRYATFNGQGAGSVSVACAISVKNDFDTNGKYVIDSSEDFIDIRYTVSGSIKSYNGLAAAADIKTRGAGNAQGWVGGTGQGPWVASLVLRVSRKDLNGAAERSFNLDGQAWAVSYLGDIQLIASQKTIVVRAESQEPEFKAAVAIRGSISYFSGQTNSQGQTMTVDPHRFLALERLNITIDFSRSPKTAAFTFNNQIVPIRCVEGVMHYETSIIIPVLPSTLTWDNRRLLAPMTLTVQAEDGSTPRQKITVAISDIELTGNVYDITYVQIRN